MFDDTVKKLTGCFLLVMMILGCISFGLSSAASVQRIRTEKLSQELTRTMKKNSEDNRKDTIRQGEELKKLALRKRAL